jgi:hypothetical protein
VFSVVQLALFTALVAGLSDTAQLVRATAACFVAVYLLSLASAYRILEGMGRLCAVSALVLVTALAIFSTWYLLVPALAALAALGLRATSRSADRSQAPSLRPG